MRVLVDINHPAHVHVFKNLVRLLQAEGHVVGITASDKEMAYALLNHYGFDYQPMGGYGRSTLAKLIHIPVMDVRMLAFARRFRPDIVVGLASARAAHAAALLGRPCVILDDTENGRAERLLYRWGASVVATPSCYEGNLGGRQLRYPGYHELAYLHPNYFHSDPAIYGELGLAEGERFMMMRFVAWQAVHDRGHTGLSLEMKIRAVMEFSCHARVLITSERDLPPALRPYQIRIPPHRVHHALAFADLLYGESATMASEAAVLGTPAIYLDDVGRGYTREQEARYSAVLNFTESPEDQERSIRAGVELLTTTGAKAQWRVKAERIREDTVDVTAWLKALLERTVTEWTQRRLR